MEKTQSDAVAVAEFICLSVEKYIDKRWEELGKQYTTQMREDLKKLNQKVLACPKCGGTSGVTINRRAVGYFRSCATWDGEIFETDLDEICGSMPKTCICEDCGKRVPNPALGKAEPEKVYRGKETNETTT